MRRSLFESRLKTSWHDFTNTLTSTGKNKLSPVLSLHPTTSASLGWGEDREREREREKEAIKIADCQRKKKRLGWMRKHAHHVKALGPFVLILSNADFLWVAEVAKSGRVCVCACVCVYNMHVCVFLCVFRLFVHSWSQARLASAALCMLLVWVRMNVYE